MNLWDNALFLRCRYERMRPYAVATGLLLTVLVISLICIGCYTNRESFADTANSTPVSWLSALWYFLAIAHGIVLLLLGTGNAIKTAWQERTLGTLEFHRASPTPRLEQALGLILGAPIMEWFLVLCTMPLVFVITLLSDISLVQCGFFYAALFLNAFLLHTCAVLFALTAAPHKKQPSGLVLLFAAGYLLPGLFMLQLSCIYHLSFVPAYEYISNIVWHPNVSAGSTGLLHTFFGIRMPFLLLQSIVQAPLIAFLIAGITRKINTPGRAVFSKPQSALFALYALICILGSMISIYLHTSASSSKHPIAFLAHYALFPAFLYAILALTLICAPSATPTQLMFLQGLRRAKKLGLRALSPTDDQASNMLWIITFSCIISTACSSFFTCAGVPLSRQILPTLTMVAYAVFFAAILEFFRLSNWHQKKIYFGAGLGILWVIIPLWGMVTAAKQPDAMGYMQFFFASSPFFSIPLISGSLTDVKTIQSLHPPAILIINILLCLIAIHLNNQQRKRLVQTANQ